jgi:hypothetical protein
MPETKKYYHNLDVDNNKVINPLLNPLTTVQRTAVGTLLGPLDEGYVCFDTTLNQQYFWDGAAWIVPTGIVAWGSITGTITAQTDLTAYLAANYYPLLSNPANYIDLTDLSAGTGISYNNLTGVITNSAPDQVVALTASTGISVTGTYPNFTITNTSPSSGGTVTGSGTTNYISKWSSSTALTNSVIYDTGTNVIVGNNVDAGYKFDVVGGNTRLGTTTSNTLTIGNGMLFDYSSTRSRIYTTNGINITSALTSGSKILIGTIGGNSNVTGSYEAEHALGDISQTSGTYVNTIVSGRLLHSSGASIYNFLSVSPTLQTSVGGTYTGTVRGFYYNPTTVNVFGGTNIAFENTSGDIIHGNLAGGGTQMVTVDNTGKLGTTTIPTGSVTSVTATAPLTSSGGTTPNISTSMATNRLIGRTTAGTGVMEEISVGTGLSLSGGTLSATAQVPGFEQHFLLMGA